MKKQTKIFKPNGPKKIQNLSWPQAKARFPLMKPYGDADGDGVKNFLDCKPFDRKRQGRWHKGEGVLDEVSIGFGTISRMKTVGDVQRLEEDVLRREKELD